MWIEEQTEGAPLPTLGEATGEVGEYLDRLREFVASRGIDLEYNEDIAPALGHFLRRQNRAPAGTDQARGIHAPWSMRRPMNSIHKSSRRTTITKTVRETEAEAVAFVVSKAIGLNRKPARLYPALPRQRRVADGKP